MEPKFESCHSLRVGREGIYKAWLPQLRCNRPGPRRLHITGVFGGDSFDEDNPALLFCNRVVACSPRHDAEFAGAQHDVRLSFHLQPQTTLDHLKKFVFFVMFMPNKLTQQLGYLHILIIDTTDDSRRSVVGELRKSILQVDWISHGLPPIAL